MKPNALIYGARYDRTMDAFGGEGFFVENPKNLKGALDEAMSFAGAALLRIFACFPLLQAIAPSRLSRSRSAFSRGLVVGDHNHRKKFAADRLQMRQGLSHLQFHVVPSRCAGCVTCRL